MDTLSFSETTMTKKRAAEAKSFGLRSSTATSHEPLIQNYSNFKRSSCPVRVMFYEDGSWVDYPNELVEVMKLGFAEGKPVVEARVLGSNCFFDFYRMLEIDLDTGNQRSISWIDVGGKCFFPKFFVDSREENNREDVFMNSGENFPKIQIEIRIRENSESSENSEFDRDVKLRKRKREDGVINEKMEESFSSTNVKRQMVGSESQSPRWPNTRILGTDHKGYAAVKNLLASGVAESGSTVTSVHQCVREGPLHRARLEVFSKQMAITKKTRGESNMVFAWYGTSVKGVMSILMHGFGVTSKLPSSEGHGIGIHLSPIQKFHKSAMSLEVDENGEKHVVLCRVILGKCEKVEAGSLQSYPSSVEYDTGVDDLNNPGWYTVWHANMSTRILPEYVVSYRPVNMLGSVISSTNKTTHPSISSAKLFSKLRGFLPQPRIQELQTLWGSCKEGKLGRDSFMGQLRSIVGDDVLRLTIQEIISDN